MRSVLTSPRVRDSDAINPTPMLECEGDCEGITAHEFSHLELQVGDPEVNPALALMYRCDTCNKARRWGSLRWRDALRIDPELADRIHV